MLWVFPNLFYGFCSQSSKHLSSDQTVTPLNLREMKQNFFLVSLAVYLSKIAMKEFSKYLCQREYIQIFGYLAIIRKTLSDNDIVNLLNLETE